MARKKSAAEKFLEDNRPQLNSENKGIKQYKRKPSLPYETDSQKEHTANGDKLVQRRKSPSQTPLVRVKRLSSHTYLRSSYPSAHKKNTAGKRQFAKNEKKVYTPIEAEKRSRHMNGEDEIPRTQLRPKRKAKRSLILKPAPLSITAPTGFERIRNSVISVLTKQAGNLDYFLILLILLLSAIGILAVYSATLSFESNRFIAMQISATVSGFIIMIIMSFFDYNEILKYYKLILAANLLLLLVTVLFGQGVTGETNVGWLDIGPIRIQPSEFAKIFFIMTYAVHLEKVRDRINSPSSIIGLLVHAGSVIGLLFLQKDLGMTVVFLVIFAVMSFAAGVSLWYCLAAAVSLVALSPFIWKQLTIYQQRRILVGFNPEIDPTGFGWQVIKSKTAIGAGGIFGTGYMQGTISQSKNFPAKQTDMIFGVIGEEFGLLGVVVVIVLLFILVGRLIYISKNARDSKGSYICIGIAGMIMFQTAENIGMCLGLMPVIGITLPFISYGGSSVLSLYIAMGLVLSVYAHKKIYYSKRFYNRSSK